MIRVGRAGEVRLVTRIARRRRARVIVVRMALNAGQSRMHPRKRVVRIRCMIECDRCPVRRRMACVARGRERRRDMIWIRGSGEISLVASVTSRRQGCVVVVGVALCAGNRGMRSSQWKHRSMIERRCRPC